jgi:hypothetical protein
VQRTDILDSYRAIVGIPDKAFSQEYQPTTSEIRLGLNLGMTCWRDAMGIISKHHVLMPGEKAESDFMGPHSNGALVSAGTDRVECAFGLADKGLSDRIFAPLE